MAITVINRSSLPASTRGMAATEIKISIRENGQIALNKLACEALERPTHLRIAFDGDKRTLIFTRYISGKSPLPKGTTNKEEYEANLFALSYGKEKQSDNPYFAGSGLLKQLGYDYTSSGNQNFKPTVAGKEKDSLAFTLPEGALTPLPKAVRKAKDKSASNGPVVSVPVNKNEAAAEDSEEFDLMEG